MAQTGIWSHCKYNQNFILFGNFGIIVPFEFFYHHYWSLKAVEKNSTTNLNNLNTNVKLQPMR